MKKLLLAGLLGLTACGTAASPAALGPGAQPAAVDARAAGTGACTDGTPSQVASLRPPATMPTTAAQISAYATSASLKAILARGYLVAGTSQDTLLFSYRNSQTNAIDGFDVDMLQAVANALFPGKPNNLRLKVISYADRVQDVQNGTVDIVADTMTINCARKATIDFSEEYYAAGQKLLVSTTLAKTVSSIQQMGGKKVCAATGSTSVDNMKALKLSPPIDVVEVPTQADCLVQFQEGTVDGISTDDTILLGLKAQDPYADVVGSAFTAEPYGMAISQADPELVSFVNGVLEKMRGGEWQALYKNELGSTGIPGAQPAATYRN